MVEKILNSHKSIIFLNGAIPEKILPYINMQVPLLAADGAAHKMKELSIVPSYIIGDGDSVGSEANASFIKIEDQSTTDFEKCILFAKEKGLLPSLVLGMSGGEIDHILGNAGALLKHGDKSSFYFLDTYIKDNKQGVKLGIPLRDEKITISLKEKSTISLISFNNAYIKTKGLFWEMDGVIDPNGVLSLRNINASNFIEIDVKKSALVIVDITFVLM